MCLCTVSRRINVQTGGSEAEWSENENENTKCDVGEGRLRFVGSSGQTNSLVVSVSNTFTNCVHVKVVAGGRKSE